MAIHITSDGDTHWLECFAGDPDAAHGEIIRSAEPGDSWQDLERDVHRHREQHGCGTPGTAPELEASSVDPAGGAL